MLEKAIWDYMYHGGTIGYVFKELASAIRWYNDKK